MRKNTKKSKAPSSGKNKREELIVVAPKGKERRSHPGAVSVSYERATFGIPLPPIRRAFPCLQ